MSSAPSDEKRVRDLTSGMVLARPVHTTEGSRLFSEGKILEARDIEKLKNWNIRSVFVKPEPFEER